MIPERVNADHLGSGSKARDLLMCLRVSHDIHAMLPLLESTSCNATVFLQLHDYLYSILLTGWVFYPEVTTRGTGSAGLMQSKTFA